MKNKNPEFQIAQLRQDKIVYAVEAAAINITCLTVASLISLIANIGYVPGQYLFYLNIAVFVYGVGYTVFALVGNMKRLKQIKALEAKL